MRHKTMETTMSGDGKATLGGRILTPTYVVDGGLLLMEGRWIWWQDGHGPRAGSATDGGRR